ncbi:protein ALP1-like [Myzus persicae]|uniref:protein ALP1-like n=1 Tax=Myzus persicae TaxID=13164 RepID=UPI000B935F80|nr:protein ALP1-like [Myzus persicae]
MAWQQIQIFFLLYVFWYLASGCSFKDLHYSYRIGISTISYIIREVTTIIWVNLHSEFMQLPSTSMAWEQISNGFQSKANFPHCIGAVDGKHIRVKKPSNSGSMYFNYKDYFSIILLAVVDSEYRFIYVSVGSYGKDCDSSIFKETTFWKKLTENSLHLPIPRPLSEHSNTNVPFVIIGDEGFALNDNLLRPYGGTHLNKVKRVFNYRLTRARRYVECDFGILSNKWRIFHRPLDVNVETAIGIVKACTVLHNFVRQKDGFDFQSNQIEPEINCFPNILNAQSIRGGSSANSIRATFADYFVSGVGSVPWQDESIGY